MHGQTPSPAPSANPALALRFRTVGFDLDGTLLESAPDIAAALNHALRVAGLPQMPFERIRPMIGGGVRRLLVRALAEEKDALVPADVLDALYDELLDFYRANLAIETRPYDGLLPVLDQLADAGIAIGVATNKLESLARDLLGQLGLLDRFACVIGGDTLGTERAKPAPDMLHELERLCGGGPAAFVGDSNFDIDAARAAAHPSVAVRFGYSTRPVEELGAGAVIGHFDELIPALAKL